MHTIFIPCHSLLPLFFYLSLDFLSLVTKVLYKCSSLPWHSAYTSMNRIFWATRVLHTFLVSYSQPKIYFLLLFLLLFILCSALYLALYLHNRLSHRPKNVNKYKIHNNHRTNTVFLSPNQHFKVHHKNKKMNFDGGRNVVFWKRRIPTYFWCFKREFPFIYFMK